MIATSLKKIFLILLATRGFADVDARSAAIQVREIKHGQDVVIVAKNRDLSGPWHLSLDFSARVNVRTSVGLPLQAVLEAGETKELLRISPMDPTLGYSYQMSMEEGFGDPQARPDANALYLFPWEHGTKHAVGQGYFGTYTHQHIRALDFEMPLGTKICAAREGKVVSLKQDSTLGGPSPSYAKDANYIDILHEDGTWATYAHLMKDGVLVKLGEKVLAGQVIALSGATGQAAGPHLHFSVQKANFSGEPETLATQFRLDLSRSAEALEGKYYYAWHPGGPEFKRISADDLDEAALRLKTRPAQGGKLNYRQERLDDRDLVYCANGTDHTKEVSVELAGAQNVQASQALPYVVRVPAHTEVFLLSVRMTSGHAAYQIRYSSREIP